MNNKKLIKSKSDIKLSGVLGGLADFFVVDSTLLRVAFLFLWIITGVVPLTVFYFLCVLLMD